MVASLKTHWKTYAAFSQVFFLCPKEACVLRAGQLEQSLLETLRQGAPEPSDPEDAAAAAAQEGGAAAAAAERLAAREARQADRLAAALGQSRALLGGDDEALPGAAEAAAGALGPRMADLYRQVRSTPHRLL